MIGYESTKGAMAHNYCPFGSFFRGITLQ